MKEYCYEIYYQYDGPSISDPLAKQKTETEIQDALDNFMKELPTFIDALETRAISTPIEGKKNKRKVTLKTTADEEAVNSAVDRCLRSLDLRADLKET